MYLCNDLRDLQKEISYFWMDPDLKHYSGSWSGQKIWIVPDPDPQHWFVETTFVIFPYLEYGESLPMGNTLGAAAVDGEYPVPLLDAAVPVGQAACYHLVHLENMSGWHRDT